MRATNGGESERENENGEEGARKGKEYLKAVEAVNDKLRKGRKDMRRM